MNKGISSTFEITESHLKFVQVRTLGGRPVIIAAQVLPIDEKSDDEITRIIRDCVKKYNIQSEDLIVSVPRQFAILKQMRLPSIHEDELRKMAGLQLINQIPYSVDDIIFDINILEKSHGGYTKVLVIIVHKEISHRLIKLFSDAGCSLSRLILSSIGILGWVNYMESRRKISKKEPLAVINFDSQHSEISFCYHKTFLYSRNVKYGVRDLNDEHIPEIIKQLKLSLAAYDKEEWGPPIKRIIVLLAVKDASYLINLIQSEFNIPTEKFTSFEEFKKQKNVQIDQSQEMSGSSFGIPLGLSILDPSQTINLTPKQVHETKKSKVKRKQLVQLTFMAAVVLVLSISLINMNLAQKEKRLNSIVEKIKGTKPGLELADKLEESIKALNEEKSKRFIVVEIIHELTLLTPEEISFRQIYIDGKRHFTMQGYAKSRGSINELQNNMVKSPIFSNVNLKSATERKIYNMNVTDFKINSKLVLNSE